MELKRETQRPGKKRRRKRRGLTFPAIFRDDPGQKAALAGIGVLFAVMLILTLIARGTSAASMPRVNTVKPSRGVITSSFDLSASIAPLDGRPFTLPAGLLVREVCVAAGENVNEGDTIARFDPTEVELSLDMAKAELKQMQVSYEQNRKAVEADPYAANQARKQLDKAYGDVNESYYKGQQSVKDASDNLDEALSEYRELSGEAEKLGAAYEKAKADISAFSAAYELADRVQNMALEVYNAAQSRDSAATEEEKQAAADMLNLLAQDAQLMAALSDFGHTGGNLNEITVAEASSLYQSAQDKAAAAQKSLSDAQTGCTYTLGGYSLHGFAEIESAYNEVLARRDSAKSACKNAEKSLEQAKQQAQEGVNSANERVESAADSLDSALHSLEKEKEAAKNATDANRSAAGIMKVKIEEKKREIADLQALFDKGGEYPAPKSGTVTRIDLCSGGSSGTVGGLIAESGAGFTLSFTMNREQAKLATVGSKVKIIQGAGKLDTEITSLSVPDENGYVTASVRLTEGSWKTGAATVNLTLNAGQYDQCLPVSAVNQDSTGSFVYIMEEKNTVLGIQYTVVRLPVTVLQSGDGMVAVQGDLPADGSIISGSDKPISAGTKVRKAE